MTEHPIIFSAPMVRALLDGRKTQTRRLAWLPHDREDSPSLVTRVIDGRRYRASPWQKVRAGDRLWVRENLTQRPMANFLTGEPTKAIVAAYAADDEDVVCEHGFNLRPWWRGNGGLPSIHMPRWASRLIPVVTAVTIEPLQAISEEHAQAEGISPLPLQDAADPSAWWESAPGENQARSASAAFRKLWNSLHRPGAWESNPEVVALTFTVARTAPCR